MEYTIMLVVATICAAGGLGFGYLIGKQNSSDEPPQAPTQVHSPDVPPQPQYPADALHIWHDSEKKQLVLKIKGNTFRSMDPLPAAEQKFMQQLLSFLHKWLNTPAPVKAEIHQPVAPVKPAAVVSSADLLEADLSHKSIVEQINDILQVKLLASPLRERGISLTQTIDGGMAIYIGIDKYDNIDTVPDKDVEAIIRASVKEWELRS
ncbi:MAG: hypothetical protein H8E28_04155 [Anaerolineae bacterium]|nr:hypothetical protein [Anaerolineae bacterium]MBL6965890.1 hypothetical protein [Anaerolineales bacterium]